MEPTETITEPLERLQALCDRFLSHLERRVFPGGCFFASVSAEFDTHPGPVRDKVSAVQQQWAERVEQLIREAQTAGKLNRDEDPSLLTFELDAYLLMGNTNFVLHDNPAYLHQARVAVSWLLERAGHGC